MNCNGYFNIKHGLGTVLIIVLLIAIPISILIVSDNSSAAITTITIKVEEKNLIVDLLESNSTTYKGTVEVITTSQEPIMIELRASLEDTLNDAVVEFRPQTMHFDINSKRNFDMKLTLPKYSFAGHHYILIGGVWKYENEETWSPLEDLLVYVTIAQYYGISFEPAPEMSPYLELDRTQELSYKFFIRNEGNGDDSVNLDLLNRPELENKNWAVNYNPFQFELDAFQSRMIELSLTPPEFDIPFETGVNFKLSSEQDNSLIEYLDVYVYSEQSRYIITSGFSPVIILRPLDTTIKQITTGDSVSLQVEARCYIKDARISLKSDIFSQQATTGLSHFDFDMGGVFKETEMEISVFPEKLFLEPGESGIFTVEIRGENNTANSIKFFELLRLRATGDNARSNVVNLEFVYVTRGREETGFFTMNTPVQIVAVSTITILALVAGIAGGTEFGRYSFLLLFIPLYTKLHKEKVLDHFNRGRIYEYVRNHPGAHFSELKRELRLTNGGLAYHLYTLEREELIRSFRFGKLKMFYTYEFGIPKEPGRQFSELEAVILQIIDENPGITQREVGELIINRNHRTVSHNIKQLAREGYLRLEKDGRSNSCYIDFSSLNRPEPDVKDTDMKKGVRFEV